MPAMTVNSTQIALTLAVLLGFGTAYAALVHWLSARHVEGQTAYLVVFGTIVTVLGAAGLIGWQACALVLACFAASGTPMIVEYVWRTHREREADRERARQIAKDLL